MRSAMRDVQVSIEAYYRQTSGFIENAEVYTTPVRAAVAFVQKLHDVMGADIAARSLYQAKFKELLATGDVGARTIQGLKYIRNVGQHLIHPVQPQVTSIIGSNAGLGFRTSSAWAEVPIAVHERLHRGTQALKRHYDDMVQGRLTIEPLLDACMFFASICPSLVHRDKRGEWTGFPLRVQAGSWERVHPEEPRATESDETTVGRTRDWLNSRPPGGDFRWIAAAKTIPPHRLMFGLTFIGSHSYLPFMELEEQVQKDIQLGFTYRIGAEAFVTRRDPFLDRTGAWFKPEVCSEEFLSASTLVAAANQVPDFFSRFTSAECASLARVDLDDLAARKARRLYAWYPIWW